MVDFRAQPINPGLLEEYIRAKGKSPISSAIGGASAGLERGLQLTEQVEKMKSQRSMKDMINTTIASPEFQEFDAENKGLAKLALKTDPLSTFKVFADTVETKKKAKVENVRKELQDIEDANKTYGVTPERKERQNVLGKELTALGASEGAYNWIKQGEEPLSLKVKRAYLKQGMSDKSIADTKSGVDIARKTYETDASDVNKARLDEAIANFTMAFNTKYPNNPITSFEEADKVLFTLPVVGTVSRKQVTEKGKHFVGEIIKVGNKKYKVTGISNPNDPDIEEIK